MLTEKRELGNGAEDHVARYLELLGYKILDRNFTVQKYGEIDLIGIKNDVIYFFEVKARSNSAPFGGMEGCISSAKIKRIRRCAEIYIQQKQLQNYFCKITGAFVHITDEKKFEKIVLINLE